MARPIWGKGAAGQGETQGPYRHSSRQPDCAHQTAMNRRFLPRSPMPRALFSKPSACRFQPRQDKVRPFAAFIPMAGNAISFDPNRQTAKGAVRQAPQNPYAIQKPPIGGAGGKIP